ncbi:MAG: MFS transporter [Phycisphaerales bacterium]
MAVGCDRRYASHIMPPLFTVAIVVFLEIICLGAIFPTLPRYTLDLGGTALLVGIIMALVPAPKIFSNPLWGNLSDRLGRKRVFSIIMLGAIASSAVWALAQPLGHLTGIPPLWWLGASRLIAGVFGVQATLAFAVASDVTAPAKRTAALGLLGAAFGVGLTVGFPLGGIVAKHFGYPAVGWLMVLCETLALLVILLFLRETRRPEVHADELTAKAAGSMLHRPVFIILIIAGLLTTVGLSILTPTLSLYVKDLYRFDDEHAGYAFLIFGLMSVIVQGGMIRPVVKRLGEKRTFILGSLILAAGFVMLGVQPHLAWFWPGITLIGLGAGFYSPALAGLFSINASDHEQGSAHGLNQGVTSLGRMIAYPLAGAIYVVNPGSPYLLGAALLTVGLLPLMLRAEARPTH